MLSGSGIKGLSVYRKEELCELVLKEQRKSKSKRVRFRRGREEYEVLKYNKKGEEVDRELREDVMFKYCIPEIFSKYNMWLKSDMEKFIEELEDQTREGYDEWISSLKIIDEKSNVAADEQISNLKVELEFCKDYLDDE